MRSNNEEPGVAEVRRLVVASRRGDGDARAELTRRYLPLVRALARRFANRGEYFEDLVQVGTVGLLAAIDRFDVDRDVQFFQFAAPTITGEIQKHLRDRTSVIRLPRRVHELAPSVQQRELELSARLERPASAAELADDMGLPEQDVYDVLAARCARTPLSLADPKLGDADFPDTDGAEGTCDAIDERLVIAATLRALPKRDRCILGLRFVDERTQAEIAELLGMSQAHVSRLIRGALAQLRRQLVDDVREAV